VAPAICSGVRKFAVIQRSVPTLSKAHAGDGSLLDEQARAKVTFQRLLTPELVPDEVVYGAFRALARA
jgi:hypothetical protein